MSIPGTKCDLCHRSEYVKDGEVYPLEVCFDAIRKLWLCLRCYMHVGGAAQ